MKFRKKPVVIEATQWFKNGDHPHDNSFIVHPHLETDSTAQLEPFLSEGKIVKFHRRPFEDSASLAPIKICSKCGKRYYDDHGLIKTLEGNFIVCPGDWIITGINGEHYPCKPEIFEKTYEKVED